MASSSQSTAVDTDATETDGLNPGVAVVNYLPPELLSEIFFLSLAPFKTLDHAKSSYSSHRTLTLTCKRWQEILWTTPKLWSCVTIDIHRCTTGRAVIRQLKKAHLWIARAGQALLSMSIVVKEVSVEDFRLVLTFFLLKYSHRLLHLHYYGAISALDSFINEKNIFFPFLESISFDDSENESRVLRGSSNSPQLSIPDDVFPSLVKFETLAFPGVWDQGVFPWTQLTTLKITVAYFYECAIIPLATNLAHLQLYNIIQQNDQLPMYPLPLDMLLPFVLPSLITLDIYATVPGVELILDKLEAPKLTTFRFLSGRKLDESLARVLPRFVDKIADTLETWIVAGEYFDEHEDWLMDVWTRSPRMEIIGVVEQPLLGGKVSTLVLDCYPVLKPEIGGLYDRPRAACWREVAYHYSALSGV